MFQHCPGGLDRLIETTGIRRNELRRAKRFHDLDAVAFVGIMVVADKYDLGAEHFGLDLVGESPQVVFEVAGVG